MGRDSIFYQLFQQYPTLLLEQLEDLGEALLDFSTMTDLQAWLKQENIWGICRFAANLQNS